MLFDTIEYDAEKRNRNIAERGLDFADAVTVFDGFHFTVVDDRRDYGEVRCLTMGELDRSKVMVVWTPRGDARRIISMRRCNDRETEVFDVAARRFRRRSGMDR